MTSQLQTAHNLSLWPYSSRRASLHSEGQIHSFHCCLCARPTSPAGRGSRRRRSYNFQPWMEAAATCTAAPLEAITSIPIIDTSRQFKRPSKAAQQVVAASKIQPSTCPRNLTWQEGAVSRAAKENLLQQRGCIIWFTGLSGSGKSTVAITLEHALAASGRLTMLLDGDNIRHGLNCNLGFSSVDRQENIRRIGEVAKLMMEAGIVTLTSFISPYERDRQAVRARVPPGDFIEVHMNVPLEVCEARDTKGLYKLARAGKIKCFTGVDDPYEAPRSPEIILEFVQPDGSANTPDDMAATILDYLEQHGILKQPLRCKAGSI